MKEEKDTTVQIVDGNAMKPEVTACCVKLLDTVKGVHPFVFLTAMKVILQTFEKTEGIVPLVISHDEKKN